jgi:hypothetical protein
MDVPSEATVATMADTDTVDSQTPNNLVIVDSVFAVGDCAGYVDGPLPALAQVCALLSSSQDILMERPPVPFRLHYFRLAHVTCIVYS